MAKQDIYIKNYLHDGNWHILRSREQASSKEGTAQPEGKRNPTDQEITSGALPNIQRSKKWREEEPGWVTGRPKEEATLSKKGKKKQVGEVLEAKPIY